MFLLAVDVSFRGFNFVFFFWKALVGKAAECQAKVCSSKRPPKSEPRSVRPNEVLENLDMQKVASEHLQARNSN